LTTGHGRSNGAAAIGRDLGIPRPPASPERNTPERHRILTAILLRHPTLLRDVEHAYAGLDFDPPLAELRDAIAEWSMHAEVLDSQALMDHLEGFGLRTVVQRILAGTPVPLPECASSAAMPAEAEEGWWHIFGFLNVDRLSEEVNLAREDAARGLTGDTERRLVALTSALNRIRTGEPDGADITAA
jgi:DNA primase